MATPVGGLRLRLIEDSFIIMLQDSLDQLGWFDDGRDHLAVELVEEPPRWDEPTQPNKIAVMIESIDDLEAELGSNLTEERHNCYIDIYAEDDAVGKHLSNDIRDILRGKMPSIDRGYPHYGVYDLTEATPPHLFNVDIESVRWDRGRNFSEAWLRHWFVVACDLVDTYGDETDD